MFILITLSKNPLLSQMQSFTIRDRLVIVSLLQIELPTIVHSCSFVIGVIENFDILSCLIFEMTF